MTYATLMVPLDQDRANDKRIKVAGDLAEKFGAKVIGITACEISQSAYFAAGAQAVKLFEESRAALSHKMAEMGHHFRHVLHRQVKDLEWRSAVGYPTDFLAEQARAADLLIAGPNRPGELSDPLRQLDLGELLMRAGRPVLVVPQDVDWLDTRVVMIAWKDSREARRAVHDALPLLRKAKEVHVVEVLEEHDSAPAAHERVRDVAGWLAQHGIDAVARVPSLHGDAAAQIEQVAENMGATVIVAGAYGHSRVREWALGGVTRYLITNPRRCALLSH